MAAVVATGGHAAAAAKRVGVIVRGQGGPAVEKQIELTLKKHGISPVPGKQVEAAAHALHASVDDAHFGDIARRLKVGAVVAGEIRDHGKRVQIKAHGADGGVIAEGAWSVSAGGKKLAAAVGRSVWSRVGPALEGASAPAPSPTSAPSRRTRNAEAATALAAAPSTPAPSRTVALDAPAPTATPEPTPAPKSPDAEGSEFGDAPVLPKRSADESLEREGRSGGAEGGGPAALDFAVGPRLLSRDLSWNKDVRSVMTPISVGNDPAVGFQGAWYPAAHFIRGGWPSYLGVAVAGEFTPGGNASTPGATYPVSGTDYWGGARARLPWDGGEGSLTVGYGQHAAFIHDGTNAPRSALAAPDMTYSYVRVGADVRARLPARLSLMLGVGYRDVLGAGSDGNGVQSTMFFPRATLTAVDANVALGFRVMPLIEARVGADVRRYGFDMHPQATDARVVSGAIDQYVAYWLALAVLLDGKGS